ncbi:hypothetical protein KFK09_002704 [Dendrobium nobile]|uniref:Uncharacterized protein n=1 Tax=Dendrobium nobile TaxID=94219 RepID=A0A8T3C7V6_DENNO|nr:hypothetical protein KFK09_002704 [Dendrobium nobile]
MLESLKKERPRLETLKARQDSLWIEIMSKKFLLVLDDIWENDKNRMKANGRRCSSFGLRKFGK